MNKGFCATLAPHGDPFCGCGPRRVNRKVHRGGLLLSLHVRLAPQPWEPQPRPRMRVTWFVDQRAAHHPLGTGDTCRLSGPTRPWGSTTCRRLWSWRPRLSERELTSARSPHSLRVLGPACPSPEPAPGTAAAHVCLPHPALSLPQGLTHPHPPVTRPHWLLLTFSTALKCPNYSAVAHL